MGLFSLSVSPRFPRRRPQAVWELNLGVSAQVRAHLSAGGRGVPDPVGHAGEDGDQPALAVELLAQTAAHAAQQRGQQVVVASAELAVLQVVLQQPETATRSDSGAPESLRGRAGGKAAADQKREWAIRTSPMALRSRNRTKELSR